MQECLVGNVHVKRRFAGKEIVGNVSLVLLVFQLECARICERRWKAFHILERKVRTGKQSGRSNPYLDTAVECEGRRLHFSDLASAALNGGVFASRSDLHFAERHCVNTEQAFRERSLDLVKTFLVQPKDKGVSTDDFAGNIIASRPLLKVVGRFFERVQFDHGAVFVAGIVFRQFECAHSLLVLAIRSAIPSSCQRTNDGDACGNAFVSLIGVAFERYGVVVDGQELGILGAFHGCDMAWARFGLEVEHDGR